MIRLAVFDLDGTLVNSLADLAAASNYGLRTLGFPEHPTEKFRYFVGNGVRKLCERVLPEDAKEYADRQYALFSEYYNTHYADQTRPYPEIESLLHRLKGEKIQLAVASNKTEVFTTAKAAGTHSIGCIWGFRTAEELTEAGAEQLAETPVQILDAVHAWKEA